MDIQEKKAFEIAFDKKLGARGCQFDLDEDGNYEDRETLCGWHMWLESKAQAVPDTYTPIVLALEDVQSKIAKKSFLTMDEENESEVYAVNANELAAYIDGLIEAQEPSSTLGCPDEP